MTITLRKADGDLFVNPETGRPDVATGATKTDQELADLYLSDFDIGRNWGSSFGLDQMGSGVTSIEQARSVLYLRLQQANDRIIQKQSVDPFITPEEQITSFSQADVYLDILTQALIFFSVAEVGNTTVTKMIGQDFKATSLKHVIPPPVGLIPSN